MSGIRLLILAVTRQNAVVIAAVVASLILGGGGGALPLVDMGLECLLAGLIGLWYVNKAQMLRPARAVWVVVGLVVALPALQLVPLPYSIWSHLPGRQVEIASLDLIGQTKSWRPLTLSPSSTLSSLLAMLVAAMFVPMVASLDRGGRVLVLLAIVGTALVSLLIGAGQITGGVDTIFRFYDQFGIYIYGFQGNRGREADHLLIAIICVGLVTRYFVQAGNISGRASTIILVNGVVSIVLGLGVVLTGSRMGMVMLPLAMLVQATLLRPLVVEHLRHVKTYMVAGAAMVAALGVALQFNHVASRALGRFLTSTELRPEIWQDTIYAARIYQPWGTGMGTFVPVFTITERLETLANYYINRAHCDYLELFLEGGIPALIFLSIIVCLLGGLAVAGLRSKAGVARGNVICGLGGLAIIAAHSITEYPLRSLSHACLAAVLAAFILAREPDDKSMGKGKVSV